METRTIEFFEIGKEFQTNQEKTVKVIRHSFAFVGFPIYCEDVKDGTPYRFSLDGIDYFDFSHTIVFGGV